ncbi:hypothetical protein C8R43DRAFT_963914 [Mycena crocata]|nr:hypothetical protein C8R43DRAFT_963914 [Mycena crocata]
MATGLAACWYHSHQDGVRPLVRPPDSGLLSKPPRNQAAPYLSSCTGPMDRALLVFCCRKVQLPGGLGLNRVTRARRLAACTQEAGCQLAPGAQRYYVVLSQWLSAFKGLMYHSEENRVSGLLIRAAGEAVVSDGVTQRNIARRAKAGYWEEGTSGGGRETAGGKNDGRSRRWRWDHSGGGIRRQFRHKGSAEVQTHLMGPSALGQRRAPAAPANLLRIYKYLRRDMGRYYGRVTGWTGFDTKHMHRSDGIIASHRLPY